MHRYIHHKTKKTTRGTRRSRGSRKFSRHNKVKRGGGASDFATGFYSEPRIAADMSRFNAQNSIIAKPESNYIMGNNLAKLNDPFSVVAAPYPMTTVGGGKSKRKSKKQSKKRSGKRSAVAVGGGASQWGQIFYSQDDISQMSVTPHDAERLWIKGTDVATETAVNMGLGLPSFRNY